MDEHLGTEDQRQIVIRHAGLVHAAAGGQISDPNEMDDVELAYRQALPALEDAALPPGRGGQTAAG